MLKTTVAALVASSLLVIGCKKEESAAPSTPTPAPVAAPAAAAAPAAPALVEVDLSKWGPAFAGYIAMAPKGTVVEFDDPSRQLKISDDDYLKVSEAPFFEDAIAGLEKDPDLKNIVKVSATEATYERTPPLGKMWCFDTLVTTGKDKWSCSAESLTGADAAKSMLAICKSIKKK